MVSSFELPWNSTEAIYYNHTFQNMYLYYIFKLGYKSGVSTLTYFAYCNLSIFSATVYTVACYLKSVFNILKIHVHIVIGEKRQVMFCHVHN